MSQVHALSDDQVGQELRKMTAFIKQEAMEKAREIEIKANEEFAIEKSKLVRQETDAIDVTYEKKFKQATMSQQITRSTVANKTRLKVLGARQELLDAIFEAAQGRLDEGARDEGRYRTVVKNLALEGLYALGESEVLVRAREKDYALVEDALADASKEYKENVGQDVTVTIYKESPLPEGSAGGISIVGGGGKIEIDNSFEARLSLLGSSALPAMRETLFGKNPNRKFFD